MRRRNLAFTLIEMVVVLVILGLAAGLIFPRLQSGALERGRLRGSVAAIATLSAYARDHAASTRRMHVLNLDIKTGEYWLSIASQDDGHFTGTTDDALAGQLPNGIRFGKIEMPGHKASVEETRALRFSPEGWADPAIIRLVSEDGDEAAAVIAGLCGRVETWDARELRRHAQE